jgi:hypothetical protein
MTKARSSAIPPQLDRIEDVGEVPPESHHEHIFSAAVPLAFGAARDYGVFDPVRVTGHKNTKVEPLAREGYCDGLCAVLAGSTEVGRGLKRFQPVIEMGDEGIGQSVDVTLVSGARRRREVSGVRKAGDIDVTFFVHCNSPRLLIAGPAKKRHGQKACEVSVKLRHEGVIRVLEVGAVPLPIHQWHEYRRCPSSDKHGRRTIDDHTFKGDGISTIQPVASHEHGAEQRVDDQGMSSVVVSDL